MLYLKSFKKHPDRAIVPPRRSRDSYLTALANRFMLVARSRFFTRTLAYMLDSLVRVSRRDVRNHEAANLQLRSTVQKIHRHQRILQAVFTNVCISRAMFGAVGPSAKQTGFTHVYFLPARDGTSQAFGGGRRVRLTGTLESGTHQKPASLRAKVLRLLYPEQ